MAFGWIFFLSALAGSMAQFSISPLAPISKKINGVQFEVEVGCSIWASNNSTKCCASSCEAPMPSLGDATEFWRTPPEAEDPHVNLTLPKDYVVSAVRFRVRNGVSAPVILRTLGGDEFETPTFLACLINSTTDNCSETDCPKDCQLYAQNSKEQQLNVTPSNDLSKYVAPNTTFRTRKLQLQFLTGGNLTVEVDKITVIGACYCSGHASSCTTFPSGLYNCTCQHRTTGDQCKECQSGAKITVEQFFGCEEKPNISSTLPARLNNVAGSNISLTVTVINNGVLVRGPNVTWRDPDGKRIASSTRFHLSNSDFTLTILNSSVQDSGTYTVTVANDGGSTSWNFTVIVKEKRAVSLSAKKEAVYVLAEGSATLKAEITDAGFLPEPSPILTWHNPQDEPIRPDDRFAFANGNLSLNISMASRSDNGAYLVGATNRKSNTLRFNLTVVTRPKVVAVRHEVIVNKSDTAVLRCRAEFYPEAQLSWAGAAGISGNVNNNVDESRDVGLINRTFSLDRANVTASENVTCVARQQIPGLNDIDAFETSATIVLTVHVRPILSLTATRLSLSEGKTVIVGVQINPDVFPPPRLTWIRGAVNDNRFLESADRLNVTIVNVRAEDSSNITVRATNEAGSDEKQIELIVTRTRPEPGGGGSDSTSVAAAVLGVLLGLALIIALVYLLRKTSIIAALTAKVSHHSNDEAAGSVSLNSIAISPSSNSGDFSRQFTKKFEEQTLKRGPISLTNFSAHVRSLKANDHLRFSREFDLINKRSPPLPTEASNLAVNSAKNRYANVLSFDKTRVCLTRLKGDPHSDYINANFIDGYRCEREYIATQGPCPNTCNDFWRMVWECKVQTISMLTNLEEKGRLKCHRYWPLLGQPEVYGDIKVTQVDEIQQADFVIRTFNCNMGQEPIRMVRQFHYTSWPDHGVPDSPTALLNYLYRLRYHQGRELAEDHPIVVHCSAGVGRTGTLIAVDILLNRAKHEAFVDCFHTVMCLRRQRSLTVQAEAQYVFIHDALEEGLLCKPTAVHGDSASLRTRIASLLSVDRNGESNLSKEFKGLPSTTNVKRDALSALHLTNFEKNRIHSIVPYERCRVKLQQIPGESGSDYINGSYIDTFTRTRAFIATQGPLAGTVADFWRMVWEQNVTTIVMMCEQTEEGKEMCACYWPEDGSTTATFDRFQIITSKEESVVNDIRSRDLVLTNITEEKTRPVRQLQFLGWPKTGVPSSGEGLRQLLSQVESIHKVGSLPPVVVHDNYGIGRTGVFCAVASCIDCLKTEGMVDVFQTIVMMRTQRMLMVETEEEYLLIYKTIAEYLDSFDTYSNFPSKTAQVSHI